MLIIIATVTRKTRVRFPDGEFVDHVILFQFFIEKLRNVIAILFVFLSNIYKLHWFHRTLEDDLNVFSFESYGSFFFILRSKKNKITAFFIIQI